MILQTQVGTTGIQISTSLSEHVDIGSPFWIFVIHVNHFFSVEPVLDNRSLAHNAACIPLPNRLGHVLRGLDTKVKGCSARARVPAIRVGLIVENLILVLGWPIVDTAIAPFTHFPLELKFEVVRNFLAEVNQTATFALPGDHSRFDCPIATVLPVCQVVSLAQQYETIRRSI